ncbi:MAG: hypothetical protein WC614_09495 [bacterium]
MTRSNNLLRCGFYVLTLLLLEGCNTNVKYKPVKWETGQWVCYSINGEPFKISIVSKDSEMFWVETEEPGIIMKMLIKENEFNTPQKIIARKLGGKAISFETDKISIRSGLPLISIDDSLKAIRKVITLSAGKFKTAYLKKEDSEVWLSNLVPILGIVKYTSKDKNIEIQSYGLKGAKSQIDSTKEASELFEMN